MRFTILTQYYFPEVGAAQVRLAAFARELKEQGHTVQIVTAMPNYPRGIIQSAYRGKFFLRETVDDILVVRTWIYPATGRNVVKRLLNYLSFTLSCLFALIVLPHTDLLFVESPPLFLCLSAWLIATLRREKLCINISDLWPDSVVALGIMPEGRFVRAARRLEGWLYRRAWRVCGVTHGVVQGIIAKGIPPSKVMFLPNGVDTRQFQMIPIKPIPYQPRQFVYAGTHGYAHGVEVILYAAAKLRHRTDIHFKLVGDGADKPRLQALAQKIDLPNVSFHDPIPINQMPNLLMESYVALVTVAKGDFFTGTRSAKIFPAMAAGRPIIHSGSGEGGHLVQESQCGIVTSPGDPDELATAVLNLADNLALANELGAHGRAFVERKYSWSNIVADWLQQIQSTT